MTDHTKVGQITQLLKAANKGDANARERLWRLVYSELRSIAQAHLAQEARRGATQRTTLIHEAYLRLGGQAFENRRHFFAAAAEAMRRICVDDARKRKRLKRGGGRAPGSLADEPSVLALDPLQVIAVNEALNTLERLAPRQARIVMLRYFGGLTVEEAAEAMELSSKTAGNEWRLARAWLYRELAE